MNNHKILFILLGLLIASCNEPQGNATKGSLQEIGGRDSSKNLTSNYSREKIYRCYTPLHWQRKDLSCYESLADTMKALCEFVIEDEEGKITIAIHNFPTMKVEERIPPGAQVARWKRQFTELDLTTLSVMPQSNGGFVGLLFEASGVLKGRDAAVMAWGMQLAPEHYSNLTFFMNTTPSAYEKEHFKQIISDYTIKAIGPVASIEKNRDAIMKFAHSFELIEEIPRTL